MILLEFLSRQNKVNKTEIVTIDKYEQRVLWNLEALVEAKLPNIFSSSYGRDLEKAKEDIGKGIF
jgi:hypothetical protein